MKVNNMNWWKVIKEPGAVLTGTPGLKSKPRYSDNKPDERGEEMEKIVSYIAGKVVDAGKGKKDGKR